MALKLGLELEAVILGSILGCCAWNRSAQGNSPGAGQAKLLGNSLSSELGAPLGNKLGSPYSE